jgi:hypothetical protein
MHLKHLQKPRGAHATLNVTSIEKKGRRQRMSSQRREEEETMRQDSRKTRRVMQHPIYF